MQKNNEIIEEKESEEVLKIKKKWQIQETNNK